MLLLIAVFKALALVISLGSGTSGGLLAPMFMSSAALGGAFAIVMNLIFPSAHLSPGAYALVAMAAVFGAASRATFAFIVFAFEITRDYNAILPLMLGCVIADMIALRYLPSSIMTKKLARRGLAVPEYYEAGVLNVVRVGEVMRQDVQLIPGEMTVGELAKRMAQREPGYEITEGLPIANGESKLAGIVTQGDLLRALERDPAGQMKVSEAGTLNPVVAFPDELVFEALFRMLRRDIGRLPVVSREDPGQMLGYLNRRGILSAWTRQMHEEGVREHGWLRRVYGRKRNTAVART